MNIVVFGASGFLGTRLCLHLKARHSVSMPSHEDVDITSSESVKELLGNIRPDIVINCAAISSTAYAQQHPYISYSVNVTGNVNIAMACKRVGAKLIYMSSDQVYGGVKTKGLLAEDEPLMPTGIYGQHKLEAEQAICNILPTAVGLRLTWMYDSPDSPLRLNQNILINMRNAGKENTPVRACSNEFRGLTNVWDVVRNIEKTFTLPGGVYNFGAENVLNSFETYRLIASQTGLDTALIIEDNTWERNLSMSVAKVRNHGIDFPPTVPLRITSQEE